VASRQPGRFLSIGTRKPEEGKPFLSPAALAAACTRAMSWGWLQGRDEKGHGAELGCVRADSSRGSWQGGRNAPALRTYFQQLRLLSLVCRCQQRAVSHLRGD